MQTFNLFVKIFPKRFTSIFIDTDMNINSEDTQKEFLDAIGLDARQQNKTKILIG